MNPQKLNMLKMQVFANELTRMAGYIRMDVEIRYIDGGLVVTFKREGGAIELSPILIWESTLWRRSALLFARKVFHTCFPNYRIPY